MTFMLQVMQCQTLQTVHIELNDVSCHFAMFQMLVCRKPTSQQISKRLMQICQKEGLQVNESTLGALVESSNADIRLLLGQLQIIRLRKRSLSYDEAKVLPVLKLTPRYPEPFSSISEHLSLARQHIQTAKDWCIDHGGLVLGVQGKMGGGKDADMSPFEAGRKLLSLESEKMSLNDRVDLVFQDADLVPLLVQVGINMVP